MGTWSHVSMGRSAFTVPKDKPSIVLYRLIACVTEKPRKHPRLVPLIPNHLRFLQVKGEHSPETCSRECSPEFPHYRFPSAPERTECQALGAVAKDSTPNPSRQTNTRVPAELLGLHI